MRSSLWNLRAAALLLVLVCIFLFFHRLAERDLWSSHEARAAQNAQSILETGDWLLPRLFDLRPELQKPPLYYWMVAGLARLQDGAVDAWSVRLPAALAALGCVFGVVVFGKWLGRPLCGLCAGLVLATATHFTWLARVGRIDMPLTLAVTTVLTGYYLGRRALREEDIIRAWWWFLPAYLAAAVAVLLKGPIGAVLPASVICAHLFLERKEAGSKTETCGLWARGGIAAHRYGLWWGAPLFLAVALPWFVLVNARTHGELFRVFFWYHNIERGFGGSGKLATHPWWFYGPRLLGDFLPWSPLLLVGIFYFARTDSYRKDPLARFGLAWLTVTVALLSCMRFKRGDYLLPAYPGAALFLGCGIERWIATWGRTKKRTARFRLWSPAAAATLVLALVVAGTVAGWWVYIDRYLPAQEAQRGCVRFAHEVRKHVPPPMPVILFRTKAHLLAFHLGEPVDTLLEWENLDWWAGRPGTFYVITTPVLVREAARRLKSGRLVEVLRSRDVADNAQERDLILLRTAAHETQAAR